MSVYLSQVDGWLRNGCPDHVVKTQRREHGLFTGLPGRHPPLREGISRIQSRGASARAVVWMALGTILEDFKGLTV